MIWDTFPNCHRPPDELAPTYAQRIKKKTGTTRKATPRPSAKAATAASRRAAPPAPTAVEPGELQRLRDDLQRVNREISKIASLARPGPDSGRNSQLPEKQGLLLQRLDLERKIRALSKS